MGNEEMKKIELVGDWRNAARFWSVRFSVIGTALMGLFAIWPESALYLWMMMPSEVKALIPQQITSIIAVFVFIMSAISRIIKQRSINEQTE